MAASACSHGSGIRSLSRLIPMALRIRCRPSRIKAIAVGLGRRPDTVWVDIVGSGDEISSVLFLDGPQARISLLLRDLPATAAVQSWDACDLMKVFPAGFAWSAGLLTADQFDALTPLSHEPVAVPETQPLDNALVGELTADARASASDLAARLGTSASTVRRRLDLLVSAHMVRLACGVDLHRVGIGSEALLWISTGPGRLEATGHELSRHPHAI
ncbi:MAG TPA: AsnC family transcriptional regulator [Streptosporangiaceae bacterium]|nr:AsnC family transcriptional regulator [Streptosporangiaceae bacterium]